MGSFIKTIEQLQKTSGAKTVFFDAEVLSIMWETDPAIIAKILPNGMTPAVRPVVWAFIANYPRTSFCPPYKEAGLFISAVKDEAEGFYCLSMPITDGQAMAMGREIMGLPKKMADIQLSIKEDKLNGSISRNGIKFFEVDAELAPAIDTKSGNANIFHIKYSKAADGNGFDMMPVLYANELACDNRVMRPATVSMKFTDSPHDPWAELTPTKIISAVYTVGDNTLMDGVKLGMIDPMTFAPYSYTRWDWWLEE